MEKLGLDTIGKKGKFVQKLNELARPSAGNYKHIYVMPLNIDRLRFSCVVVSLSGSIYATYFNFVFSFALSGTIFSSLYHRKFQPVMRPKSLTTCERTSIARTSSLMLPVNVYTDFFKEIAKINIVFSLMVKHKIHCIAFKVNIGLF